MRHEFAVQAPDAGRRLDRFVQAALGGVPASLVQRLLRQKKVRVNDLRGRGDQRLRAGDVVVVHHAAPPSTLERGALGPRGYDGPPIDVLLQTEDLLFLAKPAGVACSDDGYDRSALAPWLHERLRDRIARGEVRPEPCHRLDRGTTGVVAVALTAAAFERFRVALATGDVQKEYEVAVWGTPASEAFGCELPLVRRTRARANEPRMVTVLGDPTGLDVLPATTEYEVQVRTARAARLLARPLTGRTHQIRAHCRACDLPVIGDPRYGDPHEDARLATPPDHQLLHARRLRWYDRAHGTQFDLSAEWGSAERATLAELGLD